MGGIVLVTGATSQIGRFLLPRLVRAGYSVVAVSRRVPDPMPAYGRDATWVKADLERGQGLPVGLQAEAVVHIAGLRMVPVLMPALARLGVRRIIAFGSTGRFTKSDSADPKEIAFAQAMKDAEDTLAAASAEFGMHWTLFRPTLVYGCGIDRNVCTIARVIRRFHLFPLLGEAVGGRQPVHADDLAHACVQAMANERSYNRAYNLSGGETLTYRQMVERIFRGMGLNPRLVRVPLWAFSAAMWAVRRIPRYRDFSAEMARRMNDDLIYDHREAAQDFGYRPRGFKPDALALGITRGTA